MRYALALVVLLCLNAFSLPLNTSKDIIVVFKNQVNIKSFLYHNNYKSKEQKTLEVYEATQLMAQKSQKSIISYLNEHDYQFRSFHIVNAIKIKDADNDLIHYLNQLDEIDYIQEDNVIQLEEFREEETNSNYRNIEWGVARVNAPEVWAMGYEGQNVVIAGQDTGYDWTHPAIQSKYRGWNNGNADHNYNWHDAIHEILSGSTEDNPCGLDAVAPCDDHAHGTHTMGTMLGKTDTDQIGVAPQSKWIACRNMERGNGRPSTYIECFEWFLAPTDLNGNNADPSKAPHVINNSWACTLGEGCNPDNYQTMQIVIDNLKAAGIMVVASAGNSGSACGTVNNPAAIYENSFSVGATNILDSLSGFSSRGPVLVDGSQRMKPNVSAPGQAVRSCVLNGNYSTFSGTSMAGPHVAGVVALMISANPLLSGQVEQIESILEQTAVPMNHADDNCGNTSGITIPNNIYGYGRIDALAAVQSSLTFNVNIEDNDYIQVMPNPSSGLFQLNMPFVNTNQNFEIRVWSIDGKLVETSSRNASGTYFQIDLSCEESGVYIYDIYQGDRHYKGKLLKL